MLRNTAIAIAAVALVCATAQADSVTFVLDESFGAVPPTGSPTITFDDQNTAGSVEVTFDLTDLTGGEKVTSWYFTFADDATTLAFAWGSGPVVSGITTSASQDLQADGDGAYNILFDWPPADASAFHAGDVVVYDITGVGIVAVDFDVLGVPGPGQGNAGPFHTAAHVQSTGDDNEGSDWRGDSGNGNGNGDGNGNGTVPEPGSLALLVAGLAVVARARRRRKTA